MDKYDWADQERLVQQDIEELDRLDRMQKRRKRLAEEYREREFKDEDEKRLRLPRMTRFLSSKWT